MRHKYKFTVKIVLIVLFTLIFCEFLHYYVVISWCSWPELEHESVNESNNTIKAMILADTHLIGPFRGHWLDKLRREWQMYRAFQTAVTLYSPEVVFFLGDLFDEGLLCNDVQLLEYYKRFFSLFEVPENTKIYVVPGNHDIGFHYEIYPYHMYQFEKLFNITSVQLITIKNSHFVLMNSMAMEGDGCYLCAGANKKIQSIASKLNCVRNPSQCKKKVNLSSYSRPIIMQHFPMYRKSDSNCNETDEAPEELKNSVFQPKWDCLSKSATEMILEKLNPRLILNGHVHHGCHLIHNKDIHEYTLSSFNWRNKNNPAFMLAKITPTNYVTKKCHIPRETTIFFIYSVVLLFTVAYTVYNVFQLKPKPKCL